VTTLLKKSLLTSPPEADQREALSPSLAKRGEGRFYDICILAYDLVGKNLTNSVNSTNPINL
jgi:hypothetical protein